jgi:hypothetical protein
MERGKGSVGSQPENEDVVEDKIRKRKRHKSRDGIFMSPVFFGKLFFHESSKAEYSAIKSVLQSNGRTDGHDQFVKDLYTLYLDSRVFAVVYGFSEFEYNRHVNTKVLLVSVLSETQLHEDIGRVEV